MKKFIAIFLSITLASPSFAEMMCQEGAGENGFQSCSFEQVSDPSTCAQQTDPLVAHTGVDQYVQSCNDSDLAGVDGKSSSELKETKDEYKRLCKKKAKNYKRALMGNLLKKGKLGQLVQVLFKKKRFKTSSKDVGDKVSLDAKQFEGKSEQEVENLILEELQKKYKEKKGEGDLKALAKDAAQSPAYELGFHEIETVPVNVIAKTASKKACEVTVSALPKRVDAKLEKCEFCVEKNISSSFTNDCSYMVNSKYPESASHKLMGVKKKTDFCNHEMAGEENDLSEVETMVDRMCDIAKKGMKPEFTIETSRNQYKDKTPQLAAKRGQFIQNYIRNELLNGVKTDGQKRCDLGEESPDWLEEDQFKNAVKVTHPHYEWGDKKGFPGDYQGAKEGDYGPSPYASGEADQKKEIENLKNTLTYEKAEIQKKLDQAIADKKKYADDNKVLIDKRDGKNGLSSEFNKEKKELEKIKEINPDVFARDKKIQDIVQMVGELDAKYNKNRQYVSDLDLQIAGYQKRLSTIDAENNSKITLLGQFYTEKNQLGDAIDRKAWDDKLFNSFKMVRISGKAVEDHEFGVDPRYLTPAVKIALNALVEVENFTCVVEPIETKRTTFKGMLKGSLRVVTALASPVVALGGIAATTVAMPVTFLGSFFCEGCGDPGNIPPVLRFANPRALNLSKSSRREFGRDMKDAWSAYVNWGGLLEAKTGKDVKYFKNETEEVYEEQQERKSR